MLLEQNLLYMQQLDKRVEKFRMYQVHAVGTIITNTIKISLILNT